MPTTLNSSTIWAKPRAGISSPAMSSGTPAALRPTATTVVTAAAMAPVARPDRQVGTRVTATVVLWGTVIAVMSRLLVGDRLGAGLDMSTNRETRIRHLDEDLPGKMSR